MKELFKKILKTTGSYYFLQSFYRNTLKSLVTFKNRIQFAKYRGKGFTCNACGASYTKFVNDFPPKDVRAALDEHKVIAGYGENIFCPSCHSTARERLVIAQLQEYAIDNKTILHLSPEKSVYDFLKKVSNVITADIIPGFYQSIDPKVRMADLTKLPFASESFDLVIANHILEHIPDDATALKEIWRVLKPGTFAILQVPYSEQMIFTIETPLINDPQLQKRLYGQKDHVRIYSLVDYIKRLQTAGFKVDAVSYEQMAYLYKYAIQFNESFFKIYKPKI